MQLTFVGSADAFNSAGRGHSSYWLDGAGTEPAIVDFGGTALQSIKRLGRDPDELGALWLTHLHGDHFGGFAYLCIELIFQARRRRPLRVVGPPGTAERLQALVELHYGVEMLDRAEFDIDWTELEPGGETESLGARIEAFAASHLDPPEQALCLRVTGRDGAVVAFSGDTRPCDGLVAAAAGADVLVCECSAMAPPTGAHTTWADWPELGRTLDCGRVVLSHLGPDVRAELPGLLRAGPPPGPPVELAEDGLVVRVAARSEAEADRSED